MFVDCLTDIISDNNQTISGLSSYICIYSQEETAWRENITP